MANIIINPKENGGASRRHSLLGLYCTNLGLTQWVDVARVKPAPHLHESNSLGLRKS